MKSAGDFIERLSVLVQRTSADTEGQRTDMSTWQMNAQEPAGWI
jgi:hypothetical protein